MKYSQIVATTWDNLMGNRMRTLLTVLGISIGISIIIFLVSLGYGLQEFSVARISSLDALSTIDVSQGKTSSFKLDQDTINKISEIENIEKISPVISLGGKAIYDDKKTDIVATAIRGDFFNYEDVKIAEGGIFTDEESKLLVSSALVKTLGLDNRSVLGKKITLDILLPKTGEESNPYQTELVVGGVISDNSSSFVYIPQKLLESKFNDSTVFTALKVKVNDQKNLATVKKEVEATGFSATSVADTVAQINQVFDIIRIVLALFGGFALLVAAIGMFNTMTVALLERTRDIGIMKSIGVDNRDVYSMFLTEAVMISVMGGAVGVIIGYLLSSLINIVVNWIAKLVGAESVTLFATPLWFALIVFGFSVLVGTSTGLYPARRAAKLNPLDALRYE